MGCISMLRTLPPSSGNRRRYKICPPAHMTSCHHLTPWLQDLLIFLKTLSPNYPLGAVENVFSINFDSLVLLWSMCKGKVALGTLQRLLQWL